MWLSPLTWLICALALLASAAMSAGRWRRRLSMAAALLGGLALASMTPLAANTLLGLLERHAASTTPACLHSPPQWAVVLAGGSSGSATTAADVQVLELATRRRVDAGIDWWRERPGRRLAFAGGRLGGATVADSAVMAAYAHRQGVPRAVIVTERHSTTTWENARNLAALRPALPRRVALVTSAAHMPRARQAMEQAGFEVCPLPADHRRLAIALPGMLLPQSGAMLKTEAALHEIVGIGFYHWLAWRTDGG